MDKYLRPFIQAEKGQGELQPEEAKVKICMDWIDAVTQADVVLTVNNNRSSN